MLDKVNKYGILALMGHLIEKDQLSREEANKILLSAGKISEAHLSYNKAIDRMMGGIAAKIDGPHAAMLKMFGLNETFTDVSLEDERVNMNQSAQEMDELMNMGGLLSQGLIEQAENFLQEAIDQATKASKEYEELKKEHPELVKTPEDIEKKEFN